MSSMNRKKEKALNERHDLTVGHIRLDKEDLRHIRVGDTFLICGKGEAVSDSSLRPGVMYDAVLKGIYPRFLHFRVKAKQGTIYENSCMKPAEPYDYCIDYRDMLEKRPLYAA